MARMSAGDRRDRLVEAAIRVMTRDGVAKATTRAIATEAEMPLGVFHYAFRSKQELMAQVTETIARKSKAELDAVVYAHIGNPDVYDLILRGLMAYFDHVVAHPLEHLVTYELTTTALRDEDLREVAERQYDYYLEQNEALLLGAAELVGLEYTIPVSIINRFAFSVMDGLALNFLARGGEEDARAVVELTTRLLTAVVRRREEA